MHNVSWILDEVRHRAARMSGTGAVPLRLEQMVRQQKQKYALGKCRFVVFRDRCKW